MCCKAEGITSECLYRRGYIAQELLLDAVVSSSGLQCVQGG
jgi:hypothetical protein